MFSRIDLLSAAKGTEQDLLLDMMRELTVEGEIPLVESGELACGVILVGFVRVEDEVLGQWLLPPGALFGLEGLILGQTLGQTYRAACRCEILLLGQSSLSALLASPTKMAQTLQREVALIAGQTAQRRLSRIADRL